MSYSVFQRAPFRAPNSTLQRFDARYWSINFPITAVASIISNTATSFYVYYSLHSNRDLVGVIWDSEDSHGHQLLKYVNDRDYSGTVLAFVANPSDLYNFNATITTQDGTFVYRLFPYKVSGSNVVCDVTNPSVQGSGTGKTYVKNTIFPSGVSVPGGAAIYVLDFDDLRKGFNYDGGAISSSGITRVFFSITSATEYNLGKNAVVASTGGSPASSVTLSGVMANLVLVAGDQIVIGSQAVTLTSVGGFGTTSRTLGVTPAVTLGTSTAAYASNLLNDSPLSGSISQAVYPGGLEESAFSMINISTTGSRATIPRYNYPQAAHGLKMTSGFDDTYNVTPWRQVNQLYDLGYRGDLVMYMGASHYYYSISSFVPSTQTYQQKVAPGLTAPLNYPTTSFCYSIFNELYNKGMGFVWSTSLEILKDHMPDTWAQKDVTGALAESGWTPHTSFISPCSSAGKTHIINTIAQGAGLMAYYFYPDVKIQLGEFWWWDGSYTNGKPCIYDANTTAAYLAATGLTAPATLTDVYQHPLTTAENNYCIWLGNTLGQFSVDVKDGVRAALFTDWGIYPQATLLFFSPQIFNSSSVILPIINFPITYWNYASGNWDFMQIEDYDWVISGSFDLLKKTRAAAVNTLGYPLNKVHYFVGFILNAFDYYIWTNIGKALTQALSAGITNYYIWAYPQVIRDDIVYEVRSTIVAFIEERFPTSYSWFPVEKPFFPTKVTDMPDSGRESRVQVRNVVKASYVLQARAILKPADFTLLRSFFFCVIQGQYNGFRLKYQYDYTGTLEKIGVGDGSTLAYQIVKTYTFNSTAYVRTIYKPVAGTIHIFFSTTSGASWTEQLSGWTVDTTTGIVTFTTAPASGTWVGATYEYDIPVRLNTDEFPLSIDQDFNVHGLDDLEFMEIIP